MTSMTIVSRVAPLESPTSISTFIWGFSLACGMFTMAKVMEQTYKSWRRSRTINAYIVMIWLEWTSSVVISILSWLFLQGYIPASLGLYIFLLCLWVIQIQCIMQIITNRVALILYNPDQASRLKWVVALAITAINISVFCIWIPTRLNVNETFVQINAVWDRIEKVIILVIDAGLNAYFMWLIKTKLVDTGLVKYMLLFKVNLFLACISVSLDLLILGMMSLSDNVAFIQFHPLAYLIKLYIEMNIAELTGRIVKSTQGRSTSFSTGDSHQHSSATDSRTPGGGRHDLREYASSTIVASGGQMHELNTDIFRRNSDMTEGVAAEERPTSPKSCYHRIAKSDTSRGMYGRQ